ncbi:MAG: hypothetical protein GY751_12590 [Bacteroidetes bacterium]|nr:hypothetical protein [Bacteroidota bacterium]
MNRGISILLLLLIGFSALSQDLLDDQLRYERVRGARSDYDHKLSNLFESKGLNYPPDDIYLRAFKFDKQLELWASEGDTFVHVKTYDICQVSGELGPKNRRGDSQIPEGVYELQAFNPVSSFHLSMKVDYPNKADRIRGYSPDLGGDIFIHGDCVTIGCIPIEDEPIKELYWLTVQAKQEGGDIPIHIFPFRMDSASMQFFERIPLFDQGFWDFWNQLIPVYHYFERHHRIPQVSVLDNGKYIIQDN